jgi:septal ring-binding cell division protein DamX
MTDETETSHIDLSAALEVDLAAVRTLLQQAVAMGREEGRLNSQRVSLMGAASRMLTAATGASAVLAKLKGIGSETTHRTIVETARPRGRTSSESAASRFARMAPQEKAALEEKVNALAAPYLAAMAKEREGDPPGENSKTTSEGGPKIR